MGCSSEETVGHPWILFHRTCSYSNNRCARLCIMPVVVITAPMTSEVGLLRAGRSKLGGQSIGSVLPLAQGCARGHHAIEHALAATGNPVRCTDIPGLLLHGKMLYHGPCSYQHRVMAETKRSSWSDAWKHWEIVLAVELQRFW